MSTDKLLQAVEITEKLQKCQKALKGLLREEYSAKIEPFKNLIRAVMKSNNIDNPLKALIQISKTATYLVSEYQQIAFMAATVEIIDETDNDLKEVERG